VRGRKGSPELREGMAQVQQHVADFSPSERRLVATPDAGAAEIEPNGPAVPAQESAT
jgi:hypothetical protein